MNIDWDTTSVIIDADATVFEYGDFYLVGVPSNCLVNGVVSNLLDEMVQAIVTSGTDVHTRA